MVKKRELDMVFLKDKKKIAPVYIVIAGICWGVIGVFSRKLQNLGFDPFMITASRCFITSVCLFLYLFVTDKSKFKIEIKDMWYFFGTGICSIAFFNICYFKTIEHTTLAMASILLYTAPCFVVIMSAIFFQEKITKEKVIAFVLSFFGCILMTGILGQEQFEISKIGILTGIGSGFGYALYSIFARAALKKYQIITIMFYTFTIATIGMLFLISPVRMIYLLQESGPLEGMKSIISIACLSIISTLIPFLLYTKGLQKMDAGKASVMAFIEPLVATLTGFLLFQETVNIQSGIGILLVFISVILLNIERKSL